MSMTIDIEFTFPDNDFTSSTVGNTSTPETGSLRRPVIPPGACSMNGTWVTLR